MKNMQSTIPLSEEEKDAALLAVTESFKDSYDLSDDDLTSIFAIENGSNYRKIIQTSNSEAWREKAAILFEIDSRLMGIFKNNAAPDTLAINWLKRKKIKGNSTALDLLRSGNIYDAVYVMKAAGFNLEIYPPQENILT